MHILPLTSTVIPGGHWQKKDPLVLTHFPLMQTPGNTWHSSTSDNSGSFIHTTTVKSINSISVNLPSQLFPLTLAKPFPQIGSKEKKKKFKSLCFYINTLHMLTSRLPFSHLAQGLPQASPRVEQQWDLSVAPFMFTSQRLLTIFSQQVPLVVSDWLRNCI